MLTYVTRVETHQIFDLLEAGLQLVDNIAHIDNLDEQAKENIERVRYVYERTRSTLKNFDPVLIPVSTLNNGVSHLQNVNSVMTNCYSSRQLSYLIDANSYLDQFLQLFPYLLSPNSTEDVDNLRESISNFRRSVAQNARYSEEEHRGLVAENNKLRESINELTLQLNNEKQRLDYIVTQYQQQFAQAEDKRRDTFVTELDEWKENFEDERTHRLTVFNELIDKLRQNNEAFEVELSDNSHKTQQKFVSEAEAMIETMNAQRTQVEELVGVITDTGLATGYQAVAQQEGKSMRLWRKITVGSMISLIIAAGFIVYETYFTSKEFNLGSFSSRIFVALSIGTLVAYSVRQTSLHGQAERTNRRMALELKAIHPYLVGFKEEDQHAIKRELVAKFFGREEVAATKEELPTGTLDIIKMVLESAQQAGKSK